jgi:hypothetical protein
LVASCANLFFSKKEAYFLVLIGELFTFAASYNLSIHNKYDFNMKARIFLLIFAVVLSFGSCEKSPYEEDIEESTEQGGGKSSDSDVPDEEMEWDDSDYDGDTPYEDPNVTDGNDQNTGGYKSGDELTVTEFINADNLPGVYVTGYIVAACAQNKSHAEFTPPFTYSSAVLLADDPNERDVEKTISIQLKNGSKIREAVNLDAHPENYQKRLRVFGYRTSYLGLKGIKDIGANNWNFVD